MTLGRRGFTLLEMSATIALILILAAFSVHELRGRLEDSRAGESHALLLQVAHANRMQGMDGLTRPPSLLPAGTDSGLLCNPGSSCAVEGEPEHSCPRDCPKKGPWSGCALSSCGYLRATDWDSQPFTYRACNNGRGEGCCSVCPSEAIACSQRGSLRDCLSADYLEHPERRPAHCSWGYCIDAADRILALGGAPES